MKVKQFLKKFRISSNCDVFVQHNKASSLVKLSDNEITKLEGITMGMTLKTFEITDNILTMFIYEN